MNDTDPAAPMRLRPDPPGVTRLSRKVLAGVGAVALFGIAGALMAAEYLEKVLQPQRVERTEVLRGQEVAGAV